MNFLFDFLGTWKKKICSKDSSEPGAIHGPPVSTPMALGNHEWARMLAEKDALVEELREKNEALCEENEALCEKNEALCETNDALRERNDVLAKQATDAQIVKSPTIEFLVQIPNQLMIWLYPHENIPPLHVPLK